MSTGLTRPNKARSLCSKDERVVSDENDGAREEPDDTHLVINDKPSTRIPIKTEEEEVVEEEEEAKAG